MGELGFSLKIKKVLIDDEKVVIIPEEFMPLQFITLTRGEYNDFDCPTEGRYIHVRFKYSFLEDCRCRNVGVELNPQ